MSLLRLPNTYTDYVDSSAKCKWLNPYLVHSMAIERQWVIQYVRINREVIKRRIYAQVHPLFYTQPGQLISNFPVSLSWNNKSRCDDLPATTRRRDSSGQEWIIGCWDKQHHRTCSERNAIIVVGAIYTLFMWNYFNGIFHLRLSEYGGRKSDPNAQVLHHFFR